MAITDEMVEQAAILAWTVGGCRPEMFDLLPAYAKRAQRGEARAILEYATTLAPAAPAGHSVAEKLVSYRRAALTGLLMRTEWRDDDAAVGNRAEQVAHAMLAAEKEPT